MQALAHDRGLLRIAVPSTTIQVQPETTKQIWLKWRALASIKAGIQVLCAGAHKHRSLNVLIHCMGLHANSQLPLRQGCILSPFFHCPIADATWNFCDIISFVATCILPAVAPLYRSSCQSLHGPRGPDTAHPGAFSTARHTCWLQVGGTGGEKGRQEGTARGGGGGGVLESWNRGRVSH